ncbi:ABC transporter substrate-binding protein [Bradyrhizobium arachidis]|uniref:ABC transporter substrate-binding protein n=1 Tax=Bradyrhizobium arachidis TaxID=858423 RepID=UPI002163CEE5|nr:ABC transporter substrate-binding protein [Bradyrhizobium arachidis]UVO30660.1 ABC transporter substrate-binding protein [Bradyrhizobium arachidis]
MNLSRRTLLRSSAAVSAASVFGSLAGSASPASDTVTIASLYDLSGPFDVYGAPSNMCTEFAVKELNAAGGLLGKQVVLKAYDCQSDINKGPQYAQQAALRDRAVMAVGALTGAAREATRPVLRKYKVPYFYGSIYEGGACEPNIFCCSTEGNQQVVPLLEWSFKTLGKRLYYIASDYNAPRTFGAWNHVMAKREDGEVLADDYYPLDVTDFTAAIAKIQAAKPDFIHSCLVGGPSMSFYRQWAAAGMLKKIPIVSIIFGGGQEHEILAPEETNGIYAAYNYFQELDTPRNRAFLARFAQAMGQNHAYINGEAIGGYNTVMLWAEAVKRANSFDRDAVMKAWETGITWEGPGGKMVTDGPTHHTTQDVRIIRVENRVWSLVATKEQIQPDSYGGRCDVFAHPNQTEFLMPQM